MKLLLLLLLVIVVVQCSLVDRIVSREWSRIRAHVDEHVPKNIQLAIHHPLKIVEALKERCAQHFHYCDVVEQKEKRKEIDACWQARACREDYYTNDLHWYEKIFERKFILMNRAPYCKQDEGFHHDCENLLASEHLQHHLYIVTTTTTEK